MTLRNVCAPVLTGGTCEKIISMATAQKRGGEALGRNWGELSPKAHVVVDGLENPLQILLTLGNCNDICYAQKLPEPFDLRDKYIISVKGYNSDLSVY